MCVYHCFPLLWLIILFCFQCLLAFHEGDPELVLIPFRMCKLFCVTTVAAAISLEGKERRTMREASEGNSALMESNQRREGGSLSVSLRCLADECVK